MRDFTLAPNPIASPTVSCAFRRRWNTPDLIADHHSVFYYTSISVRIWLFWARFLSTLKGGASSRISVNKERPRPLEHHAPADGAFLFPLASHIPGWEVISATGRERIDDAAAIASRSAR